MTAKRPILCPPYGKVPIEKGKYNKPPLCFNVLNKFDNRWATKFSQIRNLQNARLIKRNIKITA